METLLNIKKQRKKSQKDFLNKPFAQSVFLFPENRLNSLPKIQQESVLNYIY